MKLIFTSFQGVNSKNIPQGMVRILLPVIDKFQELHAYYVSYGSKKLGNKKIKELSKINRFLQKIIGKILQLLNVHYGIIRYLQEYLYDIFLSFKIKEPYIIVSTTYVPKTAEKNKKLGGVNIFLAGNPYDRYINKILQKEKILNNINFNDSYTYQKRLDFIDRFIAYQDHIIAQTQVTYNSFKLLAKKIDISLCEIHPLPPEELFANDSTITKNNKLTFIYVAHTVWLKGLTYLIHAWNSIDVGDSKLIICGYIHPQVASKVNKYKNRNVEFIGPVPYEKLNKFYRMSHVCIIPSLIDDHPATLIEALYCGLPVIVTEGCGSKSLIKHGENGFIIPVADPEAIAQSILWFIKNQQQIELMSLKAKMTIVTLKKSNQNEILASHIREIIKKFE